MALNLTTFKSNLKSSLKTAAEANAQNGVSLDTAMENLANAIAAEVDAYIKTMTITILSGMIQVEGTAAAQSNVAPIVIDNGVS